MSKFNYDLNKLLLPKLVPLAIAQDEGLIATVLKLIATAEKIVKEKNAGYIRAYLCKAVEEAVVNISSANKHSAAQILLNQIRADLKSGKYINGYGFNDLATLEGWYAVNCYDIRAGLDRDDFNKLRLLWLGRYKGYYTKKLAEILATKNKEKLQ